MLDSLVTSTALEEKEDEEKCMVSVPVVVVKCLDKELKRERVQIFLE